MSPAQRHGGGMSRCGAGESNHSSPAKGHSVLRPDTTVRGSRGTAELCLHRAASLQSFVSGRVGGLNPGSRLLFLRRVLSSPPFMGSAIFISSSDSYRASSASRAMNRTLSQHPQRDEVTPNHALQRTGAAVTLAAFPRSTRLLRLSLSLFRPSFLSLTPQPARQPRRSLSLRSLGVFTRHL